MTSITTTSSFARVPSLEMAWQDVDSSFERFCLTAGIGAKLAGPLWTADIRLAVLAPASKKVAALAKLHELAGVFSQYLPPGSARWKLYSIPSTHSRWPPPRWDRCTALNSEART